MSRRPHQQAPPQNSQEESMALRVNAIRRYLYRVNSLKAFIGLVFAMVFMAVVAFWPFMGIVFTGLVCAMVFMVFMVSVASFGMAHSTCFWFLYLVAYLGH